MAQYAAKPQDLPGNATTQIPPSGQQPLTPRILHIYSEGLTGRHVRILDSNKLTPLYLIDSNSSGLFSSKPHVKLHAAATGTQVGTITFHSMSSTIDMTIHNQPVALCKSSFLTFGYEFRSLATGGLLKWKKDGMLSIAMVCIDEREQVFARFQPSKWTMKKSGKFELGSGVNGLLMDEIVTSGIAMVNYRRRQSSAAAGGAGIAAGASC